MVVFAEGELIEALALLVNFDPGVIGDITKDLIFSLQTELLAKLGARPRAHDVMVSLLSIG